MDVKILKDKKLWIIVILCLISLLLVTGFSSFAQITAGRSPLFGPQHVANNWNIGFKSARVVSERSGVVNSLSHNRTVAFLNTTITGADGKIVIEFIIENKGNLDAKVKNIYFLPYPQHDEALIKTLKGVEKGDVIKVGKKQKLTMTIEFNKNANPEKLKQITASNVIIDYVQA